MRYLLPKNTYRNNSFGFTILETLIAISILILTITAPLAIISQSLRSSYYGRDQITAYFLAQEAIEFLRNARDNVGLKSATTAEQWTDTFLAYNSPSDTDPLINIINKSNNLSLKKAYLIRASGGYKLIQCNNSGSDCPEVSYDPTAPNGILYGDISVVLPSIFTREITISEPVIGDGLLEDENLTTRPPELRELVISVRVRWRMANGELSDGVTIQEHLANWQLEKTPPTTP